MNTSACAPAAIAACGRETAQHAPTANVKRRPLSYMGNAEPGLEDLLADDVLKRLMARDGVAADQLRELACRFSA